MSSRGGSRDAARVAGIYRQRRKQDARYWLGSALRRTWLPAAILAIGRLLVSTAIQGAMPDARSIGDATRVTQLGARRRTTCDIGVRSCVRS